MNQEVTRLSTRTLGRTGVAVSEIGYGAWGIGKGMWGRTDDEESKRALREAIHLGVNYFDTALAYGRGHSERLIAQVLYASGLKGKVVVATKVPPKNMEWPARKTTRLGHAFPPDWILSCAESSLRNLRTDCIDILQTHVWHDQWLHDKTWPDTLAAFDRLKKEGKIRFAGASINSDDPETAMEAARSGAFDILQILFNIFDQRPAAELFSLCKEKNVGIVARCPFDEGGLTGKLTPQTRFEPEDFRSHYFGGSRLAETCKRAKAIEDLLVGEHHAETLAQAALKYCLSYPEVSTIIPGMRTITHVRDNVRAANGHYFDAALLERLKAHAWVRHFYD
jgi:aryl-alcohol dehydrogenase-like predicted oxidoreductase